MKSIGSCLSECASRSKYELSVTEDVPTNDEDWFWDYPSESFGFHHHPFFIPHYKRYMLVPIMDNDRDYGDKRLLCVDPKGCSQTAKFGLN